MYMYSDDEGKLTVKQKEICRMAGTLEQILSGKKKYFTELGFMYQDENNIYMKIPKDVKTIKKIEMNEELVVGKLKDINNGTKLFYTYCLYLQKLKNQEYVVYSNDEIKAPFTGSINTIKKYCKELQEVGLLNRERKHITISYHFNEI